MSFGWNLKKGNLKLVYMIRLNCNNYIIYIISNNLKGVVKLFFDLWILFN